MYRYGEVFILSKYFKFYNCSMHILTEHPYIGNLILSSQKKSSGCDELLKLSSAKPQGFSFPV